MHSWTRRVAAVAWPAFMGAGVLEIAVFAFVDPFSLHTLGGALLPLSRTGIYSLAFFVFWAATAVACQLALILNRSVEDPDDRSARP